MTQLMNDKAVYRTAPAKPGLLNILGIGYMESRRCNFVLRRKATSPDGPTKAETKVFFLDARLAVDP